MKLRSIQVLRAVAVLAVVLHHYGSVAVGAAGVDLFFVISGFIMVHVMPGKTVRSFATARLLRIFPTYWAATLLLLVLDPGAPGNPLESIFLIAGGRFYLPQAWTLVFELTFYGCCAAFIAWRWWALLIWPLAWLAVMIAPNAYAGTLLSPLFLEFLLGIAVALLPHKRPAFTFVMAVVAAMIFAGQERWLAFGVPSAFLLWSAVSAERLFTRWADAPVLIGDASYSIYLVHWTFLALLPSWPMQGYWLFNAYLSVLLSIGFYLAVERPIIRIPTQRVRTT